MSTLVDIAVNLTHPQFDRDREQVVDRAIDAGVTRLIVTGTSVADSCAAAELAAARPDHLFSTAGVHPHDAKTCDEGTLGELRGLASQPQVVAIGECGLDFDRDFSPRPVQIEWFEAQVELAIELEMPLLVHERDASEAVAEILGRHRDRMPRAVVHCFTGDRSSLDAYMSLDLHIGITGWICDERRGRHLCELVREIPRDRLMIETDAPFLIPRSIRPRPKTRRNEPALLAHIAGKLADCLQRPIDDVAATTTSTAERFFGLPAARDRQPVTNDRPTLA